MRRTAYILVTAVSILLISCVGCSSHSSDGNQVTVEQSESATGDGHAHEGGIELPEADAKRFGVVSEEIIAKDFHEVVKVSGRIEPASTDRMTVSARRSGIVNLASGITIGRKVSSGSLIASVSSKGIQGGDPTAQSSAAVESAKRELDRITPLYKDGLVTAATYNAAEAAYRQALASSGPAAGTGAETAPCNGTVTDIFVSSGEYVEVGRPIAVIARNTRLTLRADLPERMSGFIPAIMSARFRPDHSDQTYDIKELDGHMAGTPGSVANRGYTPVYFTFTGNGTIIPGSFCEVYLIGQLRTDVISLPREALVEMQGNKYAYVKVHDGFYEKRLVTTGATDGENIEILSGIEAGEVAVTRGATVVRMAETSAIAPPGHSHQH